MELEWTLETTAAVTLVSLRLRNDRATDRQVTVNNHLSGPILPPRRQGTAESGWDQNDVTTVVPAGKTVALGYACPAPADEPPAEISDVGAPTGEEHGSAVETAIRELGDHRPPRDVLPAENYQSGATGTERPDSDTQVPSSEPAGSESERMPTASLPDGTAALLSPYRTRIRTAEAFGTVGVRDAAALVETNGGLAGVETLVGNLDTDAKELRALAAAATALAVRAQASAPPTDALGRLS